jgi:hypothetical protein
MKLKLLILLAMLFVTPMVAAETVPDIEYLARHYLNHMRELSDPLPVYGAQNPVSPSAHEAHYVIALSGSAQVVQLLDAAGNIAWSMTCTPKARQEILPRVPLCQAR